MCILPTKQQQVLHVVVQESLENRKTQNNPGARFRTGIGGNLSRFLATTGEHSVVAGRSVFDRSPLCKCG